MQVTQPSIKEFISSRRILFEIPDYQRPYSWKPDNAQDMIEDLETCVNGDKNHYFGTIFYDGNGNMRSIIDGQQRITTVLLMIMAIYHLIKEDPERGRGGDDESLYYDCEQIREEFLYDKHFSKVKLRNVAYDNGIFQDIFETGGEKLTKDEKASNLWKAYRHFRDYFVDKPGLNRYINALDNFRTIVLCLQSDDDNAQRIFESINSTGLPLDDGDKIRNFSLMTTDPKLSEYIYHNYWSKIEKTLTRPDSNEIFNFFRSYLIAKRQSIIMMNDVYPSFKKFYNEHIDVGTLDEKQIDAFFGDILDYLDYYQVLALDDEPSERYRKTIIPKVAMHMRYIRVGIYIPFAMSAMDYCAKRHISSADLEEVFALIETYFSRRVVCDLSVSSVDKVFASLHQGIINDLAIEPKAKYVDVLKFYLLSRTGQTRIPTDLEIKTAIADSDFYNHTYASVMYVLCSANDAERPKESSLLSQVIRGTTDAKLSIEHIMPQTIDKKSKNGAKWIEMLGDDWASIHEQYLHTLGNLTVTGYNSEYSNLPYVDHQHPERSKMKLIDRKGNNVGLADSDFAINQYVASHFKDAWDEKAIKTRQKWWFKVMNKLWPYPTTSYRPVVSDVSEPLSTEKDYSGTIITSINIFGEYHIITQWSDALDIVAEALYEQDSKLFATALQDEFLSAYIVKTHIAPRGGVQVLDTDYYAIAQNNTNTKVRIILALAKLFGLSKDDIRVDINRKKDQDA